MPRLIFRLLASTQLTQGPALEHANRQWTDLAQLNLQHANRGRLIPCHTPDLPKGDATHRSLCPMK